MTQLKFVDCSLCEFNIHGTCRRRPPLTRDGLFPGAPGAVWPSIPEGGRPGCALGTPIPSATPGMTLVEFTAWMSEVWASRPDVGLNSLEVAKRDLEQGKAEIERLRGDLERLKEEKANLESSVSVWKNKVQYLKEVLAGQVGLKP